MPGGIRELRLRSQLSIAGGRTPVLDPDRPVSAGIVVRAVGRHHRTYDRAEPVDGIGLGRARVAHEHEEVVHGLPQRGDQQVFAAAEEVLQGADRRARPLGDVSEASLLVPAVGDHVAGGSQDVRSVAAGSA